MKGYRTLVFNVAAAAGTIATLFGADIPPEKLDTVATGLVSLIALGNLVLRAVTDSAIFKK